MEINPLVAEAGTFREDQANTMAVDALATMCRQGISSHGLA